MLIKDDYIIREEGSAAMNSPALAQHVDEFYSSFFAYTNTTTIDFIDLDFTETALSAYEQAITLTPRQAVLYYHKGQILEQMGRTTEAQTTYAIARSLGYQC
jgi:tetratricopeptide (TPR) repeat protein